MQPLALGGALTQVIYTNVVVEEEGLTNQSNEIASLWKQQCKQIKPCVRPLGLDCCHKR